MARIRTIKPEFFSSEDIVVLPALTRLLYQALWCEADREGRLEYKPVNLKIRYFPMDNCDINQMLEELEQRGHIVRYGANGEYAYIPNFLKHQHINNKEAASRLPEPPKNVQAKPEGQPTREGDSPESEVTREGETPAETPTRDQDLPENTATRGGSSKVSAPRDTPIPKGKGKEGKGKEGKGENLSTRSGREKPDPVPTVSPPGTDRDQAVVPVPSPGNLTSFGSMPDEFDDGNRRRVQEQIEQLRRGAL
jgi:hypothetical protein